MLNLQILGALDTQKYKSSMQFIYFLYVEKCKFASIWWTTGKGQK